MQNAAPNRKFLTPGEWLTLLGMILVVVSPGLTWQRDVPKTPLPGAVALYVANRPGNYAMNGYDLRLGTLNVGWLVAGLGMLCGALLLFNASGKDRRIFLALQVASAIGIVAVTVGRAGFQVGFPGVILALLGSIVLIWAAFVRYA